ncbi:GNAT family N-acetyltransferase [Granulicella mallensis]|uniref:GCN5-related N-acetyltransferase n=1 Tax=Granulicella mallensis (strain ATCC BAA-1857 / DSM 23137 / MP5ACTX8) TaxID=682795 RepID=G8P241_GRAMM|nr:GNAT family N-acetyltransferase [Granulicella mallensis]AEU38187.1 GCN5-related N-acetyltransferase [Granulicella mallensis MP5ACTX8]
MEIGFRKAQAEDLAFARNLYFETMRWMIERLFGWDQAREEAYFIGFFRLDEVRIITVDNRDVGWIQERLEGTSIDLGSLYVIPAMQRQGIGTQVLQMLLARARSQSKTITLAVVKINPALQLYARHGFRITHEDAYKFYMRADPRFPDKRTVG